MTSNVSSNELPKFPKDKILGMLTGVALGDALGIPYEFSKITPVIAYSRYVNNIPFVIHFQFADTNIPANSVSDDTEMTLALLQSLSENKWNYEKDNVLINYMNFANTTKMLGRNTRKLLKGIKTLKGYNSRIAKLTDAEKNGMQSNGCLMRCSPLALVNNKDILTDVYITNPNDTTYHCVSIFVQMLKMCLAGHTKVKIKTYCLEYIKSETVPLDIIKCLNDSIEEKTSRDISGKTKGWICNTLYIALKAFWNYDNFQDAADFVIKYHPKSDTDTNCSVAGALFGAYLGYDVLNKEEYTSANIICLQPVIDKIKDLCKDY
jgi:ADP-ribosyl-[dinitrogen reductase] hydrolase